MSFMLKVALLPLIVVNLIMIGGTLIVGDRMHGDEIAYTTHGIHQSSIQRLDVGRGLVIVSYYTPHRINGIAWSQNGDTLYFGGINDTGRYRDLGALHVDSGKVDWLTADDADNTSPDVSPDGHHVVFQRHVSGQTDWDIYMLDLRTGTVSPLYEGVSADTAPDWSPDGRFIAFETASVGRNSANIMLYDLETARTSRITTRFEGLPEWSPDSERLLYAGQQGGTFNIFSIRVNAGIADLDSVQRLTNFMEGSMSPAIAPDGDHIAFVSWDSLSSMVSRMSSFNTVNYAQIFVMTADNNAIRQLTDAPINHSNPVWRP